MVSSPFAPTPANDNRKRPPRGQSVYFYLLSVRDQMRRRNPRGMTAEQVREWREKLFGIERMIRDIEPRW